MGLANPWGMLALLGIPVIILMYILKQKHKEYTVPSLFLWEMALAQTDAQRPFQKLKKNLLMFLQILAVIIIALILSKPYMTGVASGGNYVLVLDRTMSMQTIESGETRLEKAKKAAVNMVENAGGVSDFSLIVLDSQPYIAMPKTQDKEKIKNAINNIAGGYSDGDEESAKALISAQDDGGEATVYVFTDKNIGEGKYHIYNMGETTENTAITAVSHSGSDVLVKVKNYGTEDVTKTVTLYGDDEVTDVKEGLVKAGETTDFYFSGADITKGIKATITPNDNLEADDSFYYVVNQGEDQKVLLISEGNTFLEKAFGLFGNLQVYKGDPGNTGELKGYGLYVFDGVFPESMPTDGHIMILNPPVGSGYLEVTGEENNTSIKNNDEGLLNYIENMSFGVIKAKNITMPSWGKAVISSGEKPLIFYGENGGKKNVVFAFDIYNSDLPLKKEFPILMYNIVEWLFGQNFSGSGMKTGERLMLSANPASVEVKVEDPQGKETTLAPPFPMEMYDGGEVPGIYSLIEKNQDGTEKITEFAVNCNYPTESELIQDNTENTDLQAAEGTRSFNRSLGLWVTLLLLLIIGAEWWVSVRD